MTSKAATPRVRVMVCVTRQKTCERLIKAGRKLADEQGAPMTVLHVLGPKDDYLGVSQEGDVLGELFAIASEAGADMQVLRSEDPITAMVQVAKQLQAGHIVLGESPKGKTTLQRKLEGLLPGIIVHVVPA